MNLLKQDKNNYKIILNSYDLNNKNITIDSFMSSPISLTSLYFYFYYELKNYINLKLYNYKAQINTYFIFPNTFIIFIKIINISHKKIKSLTSKNVFKIKKITNKKQTNLYLFKTYSDFIFFINTLKNKHLKLNNLAISFLIYNYKKSFYLFIKKKTKNNQIVLFDLLIKEFSIQIF